MKLKTRKKKSQEKTVKAITATSKLITKGTVEIQVIKSGKGGGTKGTTAPSRPITSPKPSQGGSGGTKK